MRSIPPALTALPLAALVLSGCAPAAAPTQGTTTAPAASAPSSAPALAQVSDDDLRAAFTASAKEMQVPGAVLVLKRPGSPT